MTVWVPVLKNYPHFDCHLSVQEIDGLVKDPGRVAANAFYPFLRYTQSWQPFRSRPEGKPDRKKRPIRYASRRDAAIFSYYRHLLSIPYEQALAEAGIGECVIAYRKLTDPGGGGKSNIEFARDAFLKVREFGRCGVVALDIKGFFESLDHDYLRRQWLRLVGVELLPKDHDAVFRAVTAYAVVDRDAVYERLGHSRKEIVGGRERYVSANPFKEMPRKICSNDEFREKVCGDGGAYQSLIERNEKLFGIPQGSPISDMLANIYMFEFDKVLCAAVSQARGAYFRYSDDIIIIIPGGAAEARSFLQKSMLALEQHAPRLAFKPSKTSVHVFEPEGKHQSFTLIEGDQGQNGLEYLGFRYDGKTVRIRDVTISRLYSKITGAVHAECAALVARYPGKGYTYLIDRFDFPKFFQRYGRVRDFGQSADYHEWTFWTYAKRSMAVLGPIGKPIGHQLRNYQATVRQRAAASLADKLGVARQ